MKRWIVRLGFVFLIIGTILYIGILILEKRLGYVVDWQAVLQMQPPIFKAQYRVIRIDYEDLETFDKEMSNLGLFTIDIWSVGDNFMIGATTDPNIQKIRKAGFRVAVLYETLEEYHRAVENQ